MHKSQLAGFIIDCHTGDISLPAAAHFWSAALGMPRRPLSPSEEGRYVGLSDPQRRVHVEVQAVEHASRVHLDIESDDIDAEVQRLEALGATRVSAINTWVVMQAPSGHRFCVVRPQSADFERTATVWP